MAQQPNVNLRVHPSFFDLMMTVLKNNAETAPDQQTRNAAGDLMKKRMRFSRRYPDCKGGEVVSIRMYESEAAEMVWQLLAACAVHYEVAQEYSQELEQGGPGRGPIG